jgi:hypothetical protein
LVARALAASRYRGMCSRDLLLQEMLAQSDSKSMVVGVDGCGTGGNDDRRSIATVVY